MAPRAPGPDTGGAAPTPADNRRLREQDRGGQQSAYEAGRADAGTMATRGQSRPDDPNTHAAYDYGYDEVAQANEGGTGPSGPAPAGVTRHTGQAAPSRRALAPATGPPSSGRKLLPGGSSVESGAGLILGMVAYALVINYLRGGLPAVKGWFAAKFINHPYAGPLNASSYSAPASPAQPVPNVPVGPPIGVPSVIQSQAGP